MYTNPQKIIRNHIVLCFIGIAISVFLRLQCVSKGVYYYSEILAIYINLLMVAGVVEVLIYVLSFITLCFCLFEIIDERFDEEEE